MGTDDQPGIFLLWVTLLYHTVGSTSLLISTAHSSSLMVMIITIMTIVDLFSPKPFIHIFSSNSSYNR